MPVYVERPHRHASSIPFLDNSQSESCTSSTESLRCSFFDPKESRICPRTRFFDTKEFDSDAGYLSRSISNKRTELYLLGKWRRSSKRILQKCFGFVKPFCKTKVFSRKSNRVDDLERKVCEIHRWSNSLEVSPRPSSAYSVIEWTDVKKLGSRFDLDFGIKRGQSWNSSPKASSPRISPSRSSNSCYDAESSIHEAILHCKRSIEK